MNHTLYARSIPALRALLDDHHVPSYISGYGLLMILEESTTHGVNTTAWVECPRTRPALLTWLGY